MVRVYEAPGAALTLWPEAPRWQGGATAAIGRIVCEDPAALALLVAQAVADCAAQGMEWLLGPLDGDTWHGYRLAISGTERPPFLLEPPSNPALQSVLQEQRFAAVLHYVSSCVRTRPRAPAVGGSRFRIRRFEPAAADAELRIMHDLALAAFAKAPLFTPISFTAFATLYRPVLPSLAPDLVMFAEDAAGRPVGFVFGLPDWLQGAFPAAAILKSYAAVAPGAGSALAAAFHGAAAAQGYGEVVHALMHEDNASLRHSRLLGGEVFRRYALFGRRLTP